MVVLLFMTANDAPFDGPVIATSFGTTLVRGATGGFAIVVPRIALLLIATTILQSATGENSFEFVLARL